MSIKIEEIKSITISMYENINLERLVLYSIYTLKERNEPSGLDEITIRAFQLFPNKFSMKNYPQYPDTMRVGREIRRLHAKHQIEGSENQKHYLLTEDGYNVALGVLNIFEKNTTKNKDKCRKVIASDRRDYTGKIVGYITSHDVYKDYINHELPDKIPGHRLKNLLILSIDSTSIKVEEELNRFIEACIAEKREDLVMFLKYLQDHMNPS